MVKYTGILEQFHEIVIQNRPEQPSEENQIIHKDLFPEELLQALRSAYLEDPGLMRRACEAYGYKLTEMRDDDGSVWLALIQSSRGHFTLYSDRKVLQEMGKDIHRVNKLSGSFLGRCWLKALAYFHRSRNGNRTR